MTKHPSVHLRSQSFFDKLTEKQLLKSTLFSSTRFSRHLSLARGKGRYASLLFVLTLHTCNERRFHESSIKVFTFTPDLKDLDPDSDRPCGHRLEILFFADDPPDVLDGDRRRWEVNRGFWVKEFISLQYLEQFNPEFILEDEEDAHLLSELLGLQLAVAGLMKFPQGHWQSEWDPQGNYLKKPV